MPEGYRLAPDGDLVEVGRNPWPHIGHPAATISRNHFSNSPRLSDVEEMDPSKNLALRTLSVRPSVVVGLADGYIKVAIAFWRP